MQKEYFATMQDIGRIFSRNKRKYIRLGFLIATLWLGWRLITPPVYVAKATFRFATQGQEQSEMLRSFLQNPKMSLGKEGGAQVVLGSQTMVRQAAEEMGLLYKEKKSLLALCCSAVKNRILAEVGCPVEDQRSIVFSHGHVQGEKKWSFWIYPKEDGLFDIYSEEKKKIGTGCIGKSVECLGHTFTVEKMLQKKKGYHIQATPWFTVWKKLHSLIKIRANKTEKNIFFLTFSHPCRDISIDFLNCLMHRYMNFLRLENEELAKAQISYLEKRKQELFAGYDQSVQQHTDFLEKGLQKTGFLQVRQEIDFLERPYQEYLRRLYEIDLKLQRFQKQTLSMTSPLYRLVDTVGDRQEIKMDMQGISADLAEKLCIEYSKQRDELRVSMATIERLEKQIFQEGFAVTSLGSILVDPISRDMIEEAGKYSLQLQDTVNYSEKDVQRRHCALHTYKKFFAEHLKKQYAVQQMQSKLLQDKIISLQKTAARLLQEEKELIFSQLHRLEQSMQALPEKWRREQKLLMQKDLSIAILEGLSELTETKNVQHQLFYVESKPIDLAYAPFKPHKTFMVVEAFLLAALISIVSLMKDCGKWLSLGVSITPSSASRLGVTLLGFFPKFLRANFSTLQTKEKETIRTICSAVDAHLKVGKSLSMAVFSSSSLCYNIAHVLHAQRKKVLLVECYPSVLQVRQETGLYEYLAEGTTPVIHTEEGIDILPCGKYNQHYVELLHCPDFTAFVEKQKAEYDVVLLHLESALAEAAAYPLKKCSDLILIHADNVLYQEIDSPSTTLVLLTC